MRLQLTQRLAFIKAQFFKRAPLRNSSQVLLVLLLSMASVGCMTHHCDFEPNVSFSAPPHLIERLPSPFSPLTPVERSQDWGKELFLGKAFIKEMDFYRAITCFKSALFFISPTHERRQEIEYEIFFAYYAANKYQEAMEAFEGSRLMEAPESFPAMHELLIALYDTYVKVNLPERASRILALIQTIDAETANSLRLETAVIDADFPAIAAAAEGNKANGSINEFLTTYQIAAKSPTKAKILNVICPGAGYLYVGQKKSAFTSFLINTLFIAAAYQLFDRGYIPAAIIMTSLETGWYFGGINGAGIEAKQYNESLYARLARDTLKKECLFPILMFQKGF